MPVLVPNGLPAYNTLKEQNVFVMTDERGAKQDIRPLKIAIVNLMPTLEATETQLIRMMANTPIQLNLQLLRMGTDAHKTDRNDLQHLEAFYKTFDDIGRQKFDGMLITGAPLDKVRYEDVDYWNEYTQILDYTKNNVFSTMHICWGAQSALYYHYGIGKHILDKKIFGVYPHKKLKKSVLTRGFDDVFYVPHSRYSQIDIEDLYRIDDLNVLAASEVPGFHLASTKNYRWIFVHGHWEYERDTLEKEYKRDMAKGLKDVELPYNYFVDDDPKKGVIMNWKSHGNIFYTNWINFVYQNTPYDLDVLEDMEWGNG